MNCHNKNLVLCFILILALSIGHAFSQEERIEITGGMAGLIDSFAVDKGQMINMIDQMESNGTISKAAAEKARRELGKLNDRDIRNYKQKAVQMLQQKNSADNIDAPKLREKMRSLQQQMKAIERLPASE